MTLPIRLKNSPLIEAIAEVKFTPSYQPDAVLGVIISQLRQEIIREVIPLPASQIPLEIRQQDLNLKFEATHQILLNEQNQSLLVGPNVFSFSNTEPYIGWSNFKKQSLSLLNMVMPSKLFQKIDGYTLRYINFFTEDIYNNTTLQITIGEKNLTGKKLFTLDKTESNFNTSFTITNNASLPILMKQGSVIDVSTKLDMGKTKLEQDRIEETLEESHTIIKGTFFGLLEDAYIKTFGPE